MCGCIAARAARRRAEESIGQAAFQDPQPEVRKAAAQAGTSTAGLASSPTQRVNRSAGRPLRPPVQGGDDRFSISVSCAFDRNLSLNTVHAATESIEQRTQSPTRGA